MNYFQDKVVVITGAASGMGRAYAQEFSDCAAKLALMDVNEEGLNETVQLLNLPSERILTDVFDVSKAQAMKTFAKKVLAHFGTVDVVINNAGISGKGAPAWEMTAQSIEKVMAVNFYGVVNGTQAFLPELLKKGSGHVVNISSIFGLAGTPSNTDYCASKFAVRGYTEALMAELCTTNIGVHLVHPGGIATNIASDARFQDFNKKYLTTPPQAIAKVVRKGLERGQSKIVYGNDSFKTWLGSNVVPTGLLSKIIWREMKGTLDADDYRKAGIKI